MSRSLVGIRFVMVFSVLDFIDAIRALSAEEEYIKDSDCEEDDSEDDCEGSVLLEVVEERHGDEDDKHASASLRVKEVEELSYEDELFQFCQKEQNRKKELEGSHEDDLSLIHI